MKMFKGKLIDSYVKNNETKYHVELIGLDKEAMEQFEGRAKGYAYNMWQRLKNKNGKTMEAYIDEYVANNRLSDTSFRTSVPSVSAFEGYYMDENKDIKRVDELLTTSKTEQELEDMRKKQIDDMIAGQLAAIGIDVNELV